MTTAKIKQRIAAMNLAARLDKLERTESNGGVFIWHNNGEAAEAAIDRWRASRPSQSKPNPNNVHLIRWESPQ